MQPVMDAHGRIAGFFTWQKTNPMMLAMSRLMPLIVGIALVLMGFAGFSLWQLRRARHELAASEELAARAADMDKLTGLPNHAKTLELLDLSLAERAGDEVTTFALIELDGMADVNAHLGVLGSDELIVAVAARLKEALPAAALCGRIGSDEFALTLTGARRSRCRGGHPRRAREHRAPALDRHRGAGERACRLRADAAARLDPRRAHAPGRTGLARGRQEGAGRRGRLRARDRHRLGRSEIHPARAAARAQRQ